MRENAELKAAINVVNKTIAAERERLTKLAHSEDEPPIMIEGETSEGFLCQIMADPKDIARIMLRYDYPTWRILGEDAPNEMWKELGRFLGIDVVCSVDI